MEIKEYLKEHDGVLVTMFFISLLVFIYGLGMHGMIYRSLGNGFGAFVLAGIVAKLAGKL